MTAGVALLPVFALLASIIAAIVVHLIRVSKVRVSNEPEVPRTELSAHWLHHRAGDSVLFYKGGRYDF